MFSVDIVTARWNKEPRKDGKNISVNEGLKSGVAFCSPGTHILVLLQTILPLQQLIVGKLKCAGSGRQEKRRGPFTTNAEVLDSCD